LLGGGEKRRGLRYRNTSPDGQHPDNRIGISAPPAACRTSRPQPTTRAGAASTDRRYVCRWRLADMRDAGDVMQPGHMDHFGEEVSSEEAVDEILTLRASGS
jgi:hypothetical protein